MADSETADTAEPDRESHLVGCSVRGPSHEEEDKPCQDAWAGTQISDSRFVLAVADGLGSESHPHIGSKVATETVTSELEQVVADGDFDETTLRDAFQTAFESVRSALQDEADHRGLSVSDLNTTLLVAAGGPSGVGAAAVGDGGIVRVYRDTFHLFVPREDSEYTNWTIPVQSDRWQESYRYEYSNQVDGVAAFSDGLDNFAWDGRDSVQDALFEQFFNFVWYTTDADRINEELAQFLNHERYRGMSGDDKTISIATLDIDYKNREPLPEEEQDSESQPTQEISTDVRSATSRHADSRLNSESGSDSTSAVEGAKSGERDAPPRMESDAYEGEVVDVGDGFLYLTKQIWSDQTGVFYATENDNHPAVKILDQDKRNDVREEKLTAMVNKSPGIPDKGWEKLTVLQWPSALVTDYNRGEFIGCSFGTAIPINGQTIEEFARNGEQTRSFGSRLGSFISRSETTYAAPSSERYNTAIDFAAAINALHQQDITVSDFDPRYIFVTNSALVFSSCDRYALQHDVNYYAEAVSHKRYKPISEVGGSLKEGKYTDRFGLAIHLYQLLMEGNHPFSTDSRENPDNTPIEEDHLKSHLARNLSDIDVGESDEAKAYAELPRMIRYQFEQCFIEGFKTPEIRPSARQWVEVLTDELR